MSYICDRESINHPYVEKVSFKIQAFFVIMGYSGENRIITPLELPTILLSIHITADLGRASTEPLDAFKYKPLEPPIFVYGCGCQGRYKACLRP